MVTQELKDKGIHCRGQGFNCCSCKDTKDCVEYVECENPFKNSKKEGKSMKKYRKKPVEIEAEQFIIWDYNKVPVFVEYFGQRFIIRGEGYQRYIEIPTLEGIMKANVEDYIIKGINEELYPCKPDIFKKTYEEV
jgi:hypothetical protein